MGLKIKTYIDEIINNSGEVTELFTNSITSSSIEEEGFIVKDLTISKFIVEEEDFEVKISNITSIPLDKISFINIYCHKIIQETTDLEDPIKFKLTLDPIGVTPIELGNFSQFQLVDVEDFNKDILISDLEVSEEIYAKLIIIIGSKE